MLSLTVIALGTGEDKPCDQPLKYYMIATLLWSQVGFAIALCFVTLFVKLFVLVPWDCVLVSMLQSAMP